ncbi:MAG: GHMP kinase [Candidatus Aramenus sp.]|nr:GHMP kinase [Candidatus Aramenus sp.]
MVLLHIPVSISGIWYPVKSEIVSKTGSIGLTLVLEPYSVFEVKKSDTPVIVFNGIKIDFPNVAVLKRLGDLRVEGEAKVPLGYGYGLSGSISLAYALGASEIYNVSERVALETAHESEVLFNNGLGDVISQYYGGGLVYRKRPGAPGYGEVERVEVEWQEVYSKPIERMPTKGVIRQLDIAKALIQEFLEDRTLKKFFEVSRRFNEELGFHSEYNDSFRKKGLIVKLGNPAESGWISHVPAMRGAYVD